MQMRLLPGETAKESLRRICKGLTREQKRMRADVAWLVDQIKAKQ